MKRQLQYLALAALATIAAGCSADWQNAMKRVESGRRGLTQTVTLFSATGDVIRSWTTKSHVDELERSYFFLDATGKAVRISGTVVIQEH